MGRKPAMDGGSVLEERSVTGSEPERPASITDQQVGILLLRQLSLYCPILFMNHVHSFASDQLMHKKEKAEVP